MADTPRLEDAAELAEKLKPKCRRAVLDTSRLPHRRPLLFLRPVPRGKRSDTWSAKWYCGVRWSATALMLMAMVGCSGIKEKKNPVDGAVMVLIPAGEFLMGEPTTILTPESPQRKVYLDAYRIYKYDVTVAQYRKFCQATGRQMPLAPSWGWKEDHPIVNVT